MKTAVEKPDVDRADPKQQAAGTREQELAELVVCSLEPWDEVWRRNQFFVDALLHRNPALRVLFVEPPADVLFDITQRRRPDMPRFRRLAADGRLTAFRPLKALPRRLGPPADALLLWQLRLAVRRMGFELPVLWINDVTYAPVIEQTGWPSLYDVTDDWLLAPFSPREIERLRRLDTMALAHADEVVVCSPALKESRSTMRPVSLVPNGVDVEHFRRSRTLPADLPPAPTAVYVGSLDERLDVALVAELAHGLPHVSVVLVGPDSLSAGSHVSLAIHENVHFLGPRPYEDVPAYLQHADVVIVPHLVTPFTDSLDPIKAYECLAVDTPTVATPVAGFRDHRTVLEIVDRTEFSAHVAGALRRPAATPKPGGPPGWDERATAFERVLRRAACSTPAPHDLARALPESADRRSPAIAVVVLNWNGAGETLECLASLGRQRPRPFVIVVDNNSTDDSVFRIRASELADELIINRENLGYAAGNNVGIQFAIERRFDVIIVLNNDTIVSPGAISRLAQYVANDSCNHAVSPLIRYANSTGVWFGGGVIDRGWPRHLRGSELTPTSDRLRLSQTLSGCCIAAHRQTWMKVGLFDGSYFLIFEDSDWSARAQRRGVALSVVTDAEIRHKVSASFQGDSRLLGGYYFVRNGLRYMARYHRRHVPRFLWMWLIRPTSGRIAHRTVTDGLFFRWAGFGAFLLHRWGPAPPCLERRAKSVAGRTTAA